MSAPSAAGASRARPKVTPIVALCVAVVVLAIAGYGIYSDRVKPFRTVVLQVDGSSVRMGYFLKRLAMSNESAVSMLQILAQEAVIRTTATRPPYNITATQQEVDGFARDLARGNDPTIADADFQEWYRQQLNESRLSDAEYQQLLRTRLLGLKLNGYLGERIPTVAPQIFVNMIPVRDSTTGSQVRAKYDAGQDFGALARRYSVDPDLKRNGGKVGWVPRGVLDPGLEEAAFKLELRKSSDPLYFDANTVVVLMVSDKADSRQIDDQALKVLKSKALDVWFREELPKHSIRFHGFTGGYDSDTDAWVHRQLLKMRQR